MWVLSYDCEPGNRVGKGITGDKKLQDGSPVGVGQPRTDDEEPTISHFANLKTNLGMLSSDIKNAEL